MAREMKSWIYLGKENIRMQMKPVPEVGPRDVLIRNKYSSICGTDVVVYKNGPHTGHKVSVGASFEREVSPLLQIRDAYPKILLARTRDDGYQYEGIRIVDVADWLAEE